MYKTGKAGAFFSAHQSAAVLNKFLSDSIPKVSSIARCPQHRRGGAAAHRPLPKLTTLEGHDLKMTLNQFTAYFPALPSSLNLSPRKFQTRAEIPKMLRSLCSVKLRAATRIFIYLCTELPRAVRPQLSQVGNTFSVSSYCTTRW